MPEIGNSDGNRILKGQFLPPAPRLVLGLRKQLLDTHNQLVKLFVVQPRCIFETQCPLPLLDMAC